MAKASVIQSNFNSGEFSPLLYGRTDFDKYRSACKTLKNFIPLVQGGLTRRGGTHFVAQVKDPSSYTRLIPFEYSTTQAYMLEFGNLYMRVFRDNAMVLEGAAEGITGATQANPCEITSVGHSRITGDEVYIYDIIGMTQLNGRNFKITKTGTNTFTLDGEDSTSYTSYSSGGQHDEPFELATSYITADLPTLQYAQDAENLYIAHENYHPAKITRTAHNAWSTADVDFLDGPYDSVDDSGYTMTLGAVTGSTTLTCSSAYFAGTTDDVGKIFRLNTDDLEDKYNVSAVNTGTGQVTVVGTHPYFTGQKVYIEGVGGVTGINGLVHEIQSATTTTFIISGLGGTYTSGGNIQRINEEGDNWTWVEVDTHSSTTVANVTIRGADAPNTRAIDEWREGVFNVNSYPKSITFFEDRLFWGGCQNAPQRIDGSRSADHTNMAVSDADAVVTDSHAVSASLNADNVNVIQWMQADEKGLAVGTVGGEWIIQPSVNGEVLSPTNIKANRVTTHGSKSVMPVKAGKAGLYVQRSGRKVRELAYVFDVDGFKSPDMTMLAEHITVGGIDEMAYQEEPQSIIWCVRGDGSLLGFTYERDQDVVGWHYHEIAGVSDGSGTKSQVESVAAIPSADGTSDELWMIVKRYVNSTEVRFIEYMGKIWNEGDLKEDAFYVDSGLTYSGVATKTITGLNHLEGETVSILVDGATHPDAVVTNGAITLNQSAEKVHVGLGFNSDFCSLRLDSGAEDGTAQGKTKRIHRLFLRLYDSLVLSAGPSEAELSVLDFRDSEDYMDSSPDLYSGDLEIDWDANYDKDAYVFIRQSKPLPTTILAIMPQMNTQDR